jgi:hypothetical protein
VDLGRKDVLARASARGATLSRTVPRFGWADSFSSSVTHRAVPTVTEMASSRRSDGSPWRLGFLEPHSPRPLLDHPPHRHSPDHLELV